MRPIEEIRAAFVDILRGARSRMRVSIVFAALDELEELRGENCDTHGYGFCGLDRCLKCTRQRADAAEELLATAIEQHEAAGETLDQTVRDYEERLRDLYAQQEALEAKLAKAREVLRIGERLSHQELVAVVFAARAALSDKEPAPESPMAAAARALREKGEQEKAQQESRHCCRGAFLCDKHWPGEKP